ncbi:hypothetical protein BN381_420027 [Candidatus Microthrix parvicella RN1]|uniref:Uncharacterized protein n=1 Tax=Candidatus Neomicrothrix parvicella RN1 TaxID=1229780 RepID=R4Z1J3_9ACTN|nr:hypothetical protein BN381_420027 [Candidatus Microthrix parvicella RN1]
MAWAPLISVTRLSSSARAGWSGAPARCWHLDLASPISSQDLGPMSLICFKLKVSHGWDCSYGLGINPPYPTCPLFCPSPCHFVRLAA